MKSKKQNRDMSGENRAVDSLNKLAKKLYSTPRLTIYGGVEKITKGGGTGPKEGSQPTASRIP
ncbi:MAG: hypothetical protein V3U24_00315 [Candidatus Neomarinimicrobiota bacterium]